MKIATIHKRKKCHLCNKWINPEEKCFMFYSNHVPSPIPDTVTVIPNGCLRFRHFICQYETKDRTTTFLEYMAVMCNEDQRKTLKRKYKRIMKKQRESLVQKTILKGF